MAIPAFIRNHKLVTTLVLVIAVPLVALTIYTFAALHYVYASGERAGFLQKISKKGWICKTWEGEIQLAAIPGSMPEKFEFTVRSDSIAEVLNKLNGERVVVTYEQHKGLPTSCFGDTEYFVTQARAVGQ
ncbi:MAG TPA: hypothetical protein VGQ44_18750 [Gemmatimonadaceae bacterium]|jgi:hypothetical protein|nr:hypothetical protein [Gemmatimonadaceae bacterium]